MRVAQAQLLNESLKGDALNKALQFFQVSSAQLPADPAGFAEEIQPLKPLLQSLAVWDFSEHEVIETFRSWGAKTRGELFSAMAKVPNRGIFFCNVNKWRFKTAMASAGIPVTMDEKQCAVLEVLNFAHGQAPGTGLTTEDIVGLVRRNEYDLGYIVGVAHAGSRVPITDIRDAARPELWNVPIPRYDLPYKQLHFPLDHSKAMNYRALREALETNPKLRVGSRPGCIYLRHCGTRIPSLSTALGTDGQAWGGTGLYTDAFGTLEDAIRNDHMSAIAGNAGEYIQIFEMQVGEAEKARILGQSKSDGLKLVGTYPGTPAAIAAQSGYLPKNANPELGVVSKHLGASLSALVLKKNGLLGAFSPENLAADEFVVYDVSALRLVVTQDPQAKEENVQPGTVPNLFTLVTCHYFPATGTFQLDPCAYQPDTKDTFERPSGAPVPAAYVEATGAKLLEGPSRELGAPVFARLHISAEEPYGEHYTSDDGGKVVQAIAKAFELELANPLPSEFVPLHNVIPDGVDLDDVAIEGLEPIWDRTNNTPIAVKFVHRVPEQKAPAQTEEPVLAGNAEAVAGGAPLALDF